MLPSVSIIVCLYNAERTLHRCIDSVLKQTLKDFEILLIDDGSTDASPSICDAYAKQDERIHVAHLSHNGICQARQTGLEMARGEYLIFLDADDYVKPDMYDRFYRLASDTHSDISFCGWVEITDGVERLHPLCQDFNSIDDILRALLSYQGAYLWNTLIKRNLLVELQIHFPTDNISYGEDTLFLLTLLSKYREQSSHPMISFEVTPLYYYDHTANPNSLMKISPAELNMKRLAIWERVRDIIDMRSFATPYFNRIVSYAFSALKEEYYDSNKFHDLFSSFKNDIKKHAVPSIRKHLVLVAIEKGYKNARRLLWVSGLSETIHSFVMVLKKQ